MNLFNAKKKNDLAAVQTAPSTTNYKHPFSALNRYVPLSSTELRLYSTLKEAVPIIDAAISKIVRLVGNFRVKCEDQEVEFLLNNFLNLVKVNSSGQGVGCFISTYLNQLLTFGTSVGEIIPTINGDGICGLYNASLEDIELKTDSSPLKLSVCKKDCKGKSTPIKFPELIIVSALNPDPGAIYGNSIMKGLPFVSQILMTIYNSICINWERVGNVRFAVTYKPGADAGEKAYAKERAMQIATEWGNAMKGDGVSDFIAVGDVNIKVIGADNQVLDSQIPVRQMLEQIVSKLSIPPFLLGLSWSTSERMSSQQADILTSELDAYRRILNPTISKICSMWMRINGYWSNYEILWDNINLQDEVQLANARLLSARAKEIEKKLEKQIEEDIF